jgi:hypothetical protein
MTSARLRALALVVGAFGAGGCAAFDSQESNELLPAYALQSINGIGLPAVITVPGGEQRRIIADTLRFPTAGFYTEITISQSVEGTAPPIERFDRPAGPYVNASANLQLPAFAGGSGTAAYSGRTLTVFALDSRTWNYVAVP